MRVASGVVGGKRKRHSGLCRGLDGWRWWAWCGVERGREGMGGSGRGLGRWRAWCGIDVVFVEIACAIGLLVSKIVVGKIFIFGGVAVGVVVAYVHRDTHT